MNYANMVSGTFLARPNRFIAHVDIAGQTETVHVKNTGRCKELLVPGTRVWCQEASSPARKTRFDLITVEKGGRLINMDSQAPNAAAKEWLLSGGFGEIEALRADDRFTAIPGFEFFPFFRDGKLWFLEVKGVTPGGNGVCAFPDAPTLRGAKHLRGLTHAAAEGYGAGVLFVIQMADVKYLHPNDATDLDFGAALRDAAGNGVHILAMDCAVTEQSMTIRSPVEVRL